MPGSTRGVAYTSLTGGKPVTPQVLFGRDLRPEGHDAHQGRYGDPSGHSGTCYLVATEAVYAAFHPKVIKSAFLTSSGDLRRSPGGKPAARFFVKDHASQAFKPAKPATYDGRAPVRTAMGKLAFDKLVDPKRIWSPMLEYTYTKFRNQEGGAVHSEDPNKDRAGYNRTANGGYANHVMEALTGKPARTLVIDPRHEDELWKSLNDAQAQNKVVVVGSLGATERTAAHPGQSSAKKLTERVNAAIADGYVDGRSKNAKFDDKRWVEEHAYSAWGDKDHPFVFEENGERMIRLRNPWGLVPPGGKGQDGVGTVPFKQFVLRYDRVYVGDSEPAE